MQIREEMQAFLRIVAGGALALAAVFPVRFLAPMGSELAVLGFQPVFVALLCGSLLLHSKWVLRKADLLDRRAGHTTGQTGSRSSLGAVIADDAGFSAFMQHLLTGALP